MLEQTIQNPPKTILGSLRFLGPGLILSAGIVGSGELIATTSMGAEVGFTLLWVILVACLFKVTIQLEYGRYCITFGESAFRAWNKEIGWRFWGINSSIYIAFLFMVATFIGQGGVIGGSAQVANFIVPSISVPVWSIILAVSIALIVFRGYYGPVEWLSIAMNAIFISVIFYCVFRVQGTKYAFSWSDVGSGLLFHLPASGVVKAIAVFGIVGLGAGEIVFYPYWCLEKGYAAWSGTNDGSEEWLNRARGWIRVMNVDAFVSMLVYTFATVGFYFLGATVLHSQEKLADGNALVLQLSSLFTQVLGDGTRLLFMICAFTVLYSTAFANTAGFSRMWTDFLELCRFITPDQPEKRKLSLAVFSWLLPVSWAITYFIMQQPLVMVIFMGITNSMFLLVVAYKAMVFRYRFTGPILKPSGWYDISLWISFLSINFVGLKVLYSLYMDTLK